MKLDIYTKVVLSMIAAALIALVARSFQNPPTVSAQQVRPQHVIIDDLGSRFAERGLPVFQGSQGTLHVIIDGVDPILSVRGGIPVSSASISFQSPQLQQTSWQYSAGDCTLGNLNAQGLLGWELVATVESPGHAFSYDPRTGRGQISGLVLEEKNNQGPAQYAVCYFKKR